MRRIQVNKGCVALVYRGGEYQRALTAGKHWIGFAENVSMHNQSEQLMVAVDYDVLLDDAALREMLDVMEVDDTHLVLRLDRGVLKAVLTSGRYLYWRAAKYDYIRADMNQLEIGNEISRALLQRAELYKYIRIYAVESYEQALLLIDGNVEGELKAGKYYYWKNAIDVNVLKVDTRQQQIEVSGQEVLTKDKAALRLNFYAHYRVVDIRKALLKNKDYSQQLYLLLQMALREYVGGLTLDELLENREALAGEVLTGLRDKTDQLGVEMVACGLRDVILTGEMKEIMNQVLVAQKKAQANSIMRREETASTRSLMNTAKLMEDNEMLFKLKEMEYVEKIAEKINSITVSGGGQVVDRLRELFVK